MTTQSVRRPAIELLEARIAPAAAGVIDLSLLDGASGFVVQGQQKGDNLGDSIRPIGDFNGDGALDFAVGLDQTPRDSESEGPGRVAVIFGTGDLYPKSIKPSDLDGTNGFVIVGTEDGGFFGDAVSGGDFNDDGFADLAVGAVGTSFFTSNGGSIYVFFGGSGPFPAQRTSAVNGTDGFRMDGASTNGFLGRLGTSGDVNGDGIDDLVAGAVATDVNGTDTGSAYVLFGHTGAFAATITTAALNGLTGFRVDGTVGSGRLGDSLISGFDLNNDGIDDLAISAPGLPFDAFGNAYVLFGSTSPFAASINASALTGTTGVTLTTSVAQNLGRDLRVAGDLNGDGLDDLILGSLSDDVFVLYGRSGVGFSSPLSVDALNGTTGFHMFNNEGGTFGQRVTGLGDFNGDGLDDVAISAPFADAPRDNSGLVFIVFGRDIAFPADLNVSDITPAEGFKIFGQQTDGAFGFDMAGIGDLNGDGLGDLAVGASSETANGKPNAGNAYVIFGYNERIIPGKNGVAVIDADGDMVTISVKGEKVVPQDLTIDPDGSIAEIDLSRFASPSMAGGKVKALDFKLDAKTLQGGLGDGLAKVKKLKADGIKLGKVIFDGDLGELTAGDGTTVGKSIKIKGNLGSDSGPAVESNFNGGVGSLKVGGDIMNVDLKVKKLGKLTVGGGFAGSDLLGEGDLGTFKIVGELKNSTMKVDGKVKSLIIGGDVFESEVRTNGSFAKLTINGDVDSATISARGVLDPKNAGKAVAFKNVLIKGDMRHSQLLAGYDKTGAAVNADANIGKLTINGDFEESSIAAGATAGTNGLFGDGDDALITGGNSVVAKIASITIKGSVIGTAGALDHFGIVAEEVGTLKIGDETQELTDGPGNDTTPVALGGTDDVKVREVAEV